MTVEICDTYITDSLAMPLGGLNTILLCMEVVAEDCFLASTITVAVAIECLSHQRKQMELPIISLNSIK